MTDEEHIKTERSLINLFLRHNETVEAWIESKLLAQHFDFSHRRILRAILDAYENDHKLTRKSYIDYLEKGKADSRQDILAEEILFGKIAMLETDLDDFSMLLNKILDTFLLQSTIENMKRFGNIKENKGVRTALAGLVDSLQSLSENMTQEKKGIFEDIVEYSPVFYQRLKDIRDGKIAESEHIECGIKELDYAMTIGFAPGTLTLLVADVGSYKTTLMLNIAANIWKYKGKNVLFVPLEMPRQQIFQKLVSRETGITFDKLENAKDLNKDEMIKIRNEMKSWEEMKNRFYIMEYIDRTKVSTIRREIEKNIDTFKPDLVVVDYIANLVPDLERNNRNDLEIGDMLKSLRTMGRHLGFHVLSGAQLGREALKRIRRQSSDKMMAYSEDVRGSHEYSADADFIFVLMPDPQQPGSLLHVMILKSRFGKKIFADNRMKVALDVKPEISLIKSREDILLNVDANKVISKVEEEDFSFSDDSVLNDDLFG